MKSLIFPIRKNRGLSILFLLFSINMVFSQKCTVAETPQPFLSRETYGAITECYRKMKNSADTPKFEIMVINFGPYGRKRAFYAGVNSEKKLELLELFPDSIGFHKRIAFSNAFDTSLTKDIKECNYVSHCMGVETHVMNTFVVSNGFENRHAELDCLEGFLEKTLATNNNVGHLQAFYQTLKRIFLVEGIKIED